LIAESTDWWPSRTLLARGVAFAEAIPPSVNSEMRKVHAPAAQTITLTSRTGVIPLSVGSGLGYPVDVVLRVDSDKLRFPDGNRITISKLQPPNQTIQVRAITQSSGTFPLDVRLFTPEGTLIADSQLTIRSTAYNVVALSITGAAGIFMVGWWLFGWLRRRLPGSSDTGEDLDIREEDSDEAGPDVLFVSEEDEPVPEPVAAVSVAGEQPDADNPPESG
jgi:hypothetical protein